MFDYSKIDWNKYTPFTKLDLDKCEFRFKESDTQTLKVTVNAFMCNDVRLVCKEDDIFDGPFTLRLTRPLPLENVKSCSCYADDGFIIINEEVYRVAESDIDYFVSDFHGNPDEVHKNLLKHLYDYLVVFYGIN